MAVAHEVNEAEVAAVYGDVAAIVADALAREPREVTMQSRLIEDLGAESIDFLDIVFRLEQRFHVQIPRGKILEDARGELSEQEFETGGRLTPAGMRRLQAYLTEVPAERFHSGMLVAEIPLLFTVETFCKVLVRAMRTAEVGSRR